MGCNRTPNPIESVTPSRDVICKSIESTVTSNEVLLWYLFPVKIYRHCCLIRTTVYEFSECSDYLFCVENFLVKRKINKKRNSLR